MFSSLRFRLPALFLLGIVVSGLIAAVVALRLFQGYVLSRSKADLRREAIGLTEVFAQQAITANDTGVLCRASRRQLERATGDRLFYVGVSPVPGQERRSVGIERLPQSTVDWRSGKTVTFEFTPPGAKKTYLAVARPLKLGEEGARVRRPDRREAEDGVEPSADPAARAAGDRVARRDLRRGPARLVPVAAHHAARARAVARDRRDRARQLRRRPARGARRR